MTNSAIQMNVRFQLDYAASSASWGLILQKTGSLFYFAQRGSTQTVQLHCQSLNHPAMHCALAMSFVTED